MDSDIQSTRKILTCLAPCKVMAIVTEKKFFFFFFTVWNQFPNIPAVCNATVRSKIPSYYGISFPLCCTVGGAEILNYFQTYVMLNSLPQAANSIPSLASSSLHCHYHCQEMFTLCIKVSCSQMFYSVYLSNPSQDDITPSSAERWKSWTVVLD